jgi:hypothetical protein
MTRVNTVSPGEDVLDVAVSTGDVRATVCLSYNDDAQRRSRVDRIIRRAGQLVVLAGQPDAKPKPPGYFQGDESIATVLVRPFALTIAAAEIVVEQKERP